MVGPRSSYYATSISGDVAPPDYGPRLDGFFTGNANDEVTFAFDDVLFDVYDDDTARLYGEISVAEFNNTGGPAPTPPLGIWTSGSIPARAATRATTTT